MKNYITISRQYGSGGREIGRRLAERLGIPFYDREIITETAFKTGFSEDYIKRLGEYSNSRNWFEHSFSFRDSSGLSPEDQLFCRQREVILDMAAKGPCVIVGRCADFILRDRNDVLNVFIHADYEKRRDRISRIYNDPSVTDRLLKDIDRKRSFNYKYYTEREWGRCDNYHVTLDSGELGTEACVSILEDICRKV